jgi:hypothetical protein
MRTTFIAGAVVCIAIGFFCSFVLLREVARESPGFFHDLGNCIGLFFDASYIFLTFAPAVMLFQSKSSGRRHFGLIIIGAIEILVIVLFAKIVRGL